MTEKVSYSKYSRLKSCPSYPSISNVTDFDSYIILSYGQMAKHFQSVEVLAEWYGKEAKSK